MLEEYSAPALLDLHFFETKNKELGIVANSPHISMESIAHLSVNLSRSLKEFHGSAIYLPIEDKKLGKPLETIGELYDFLEDESYFPFFLRFLRQHFSNSHWNLIILGIKNEQLSHKSLVALSLSNLVFPKAKVKKK